jgi:predicted ATPase/DNA-binding SARP family transcriptional activator
MNENFPPAALELTLFGSLDARIHGAAIEGLHSRRAGWLLAFLALRAGQEVPYSFLSDCLWSNSADTNDPNAGLRQSIAHLRKILGGQAFRLTKPTKTTLRLDLTDAAVDVQLFDRAIRAGDAASLEQAVGLHRAPLLADCADVWVIGERDKRERHFLSALETLSHAAMQREDWTTAVGYLRRAILADPLREAAHRALMQALAAQREFAAMMQAYRDLRVYLSEHFGCKPSEETQALYQRLRDEVSRKTSAPAFVAHDPPPTIGLGFVPAPLTTLIGRDEEREQIRTALNAARLVTLIGEGGIGKTRLAIQAAADARQSYRGGAWFVELASLTDAGQITRQVASALKLDLPTAQELEAGVTAALRDETLLLVLDNCEHLSEGAARFAVTLLTACPAVTILATSRQPLGVLGEVCRRVLPLALPDRLQSPRNRAAHAETVRCSPAAQLFASRASDVEQQFAITDANAETIARLCRLLDGIPLAIELAATQIAMWPVEEIASRLEQSRQWLTHHSPTLLPHQHTLWAVMERSYDLLTCREKVLFQTLSVFAGYWTAHAAETICASEDLPTEDVLPLLTGLVQKSLVVRPPQSLRYALLETVREFAREKLEASGGAAQAQQRHGIYFSDWLVTTGYDAEAEQPEAWRRIEAEYSNLSAALDWVETAEGTAERNLQMANRLSGFWQARGAAAEGRRRLKRALEREDDSHNMVTHARAHALSASGKLAWQQRDYEAAGDCFGQALPLYDALGDALSAAYMRMWQGNIAYHLMQYGKAHALYCACLRVGRERSDATLTAYALIWLGNVAYRRGCLEQCRAHQEEAWTLAQQLGIEEIQAHCLFNLAQLALREGNLPEARTQHWACLDIRQRIEDNAGLLTSLEHLAYLALAQKEPASAARLLGAADSLRQAQGTTISPNGYADHDAAMTQAQTQLGQAKFDILLTEGKQMSSEQMLATARNVCGE